MLRKYGRSKEEYNKVINTEGDKNKKKGSSRIERIPLEIQGDIYLHDISQYNQLLPKQLPKLFTSKDYKLFSKLSMKNSQVALHVLCYIGVINKVKKLGRNIQYEIFDSN